MKPGGVYIAGYYFALNVYFQLNQDYVFSKKKKKYTLNILLWQLSNLSLLIDDNNNIIKSFGINF